MPMCRYGVLGLHQLRESLVRVTHWAQPWEVTGAELSNVWSKICPGD
jgi:hypothetical protein